MRLRRTAHRCIPSLRDSVIAAPYFDHTRHLKEYESQRTDALFCQTTSGEHHWTRTSNAITFEVTYNPG